jgi:DNA polymerase-4
MMQKPIDTLYLFIDMNAFFASCEQQTHPQLRHKPVAVTPVNVPSGCVVSGSYEARAFGVKTGTSVSEAKLLCPNITVLESNVNLYLDFHQKLIKILSGFSPFLVIKSIDEAVIKLSLSERNSQSAIKLAKNIKETIVQKLGKYMRSSIGIGPNVWLAKMAAESEKPDGLVEIKINQLSEFYNTLKLTDFCGINFRSARHFNALGIYRPIDLFLLPRDILSRKLGIAGEYWYLRMHGYNIDIFAPKTKTIGHSHVLEPIFRNWPKAWSVCQKLIEKAGRRLRQEKMTASGVHLGISFLHQKWWHKGVKTSVFSDSQTFSQIVQKLWQEVPRDAKPLKIAVSLYNLNSPTAYQQKIFSQMQKIDDIYYAVDKINDRYGNFTIKPASLMSVESSAPNRIAFGRPIK